MVSWDGVSGGDATGDAADTDMGGSPESSDMGGENGGEIGEFTDLEDSNDRAEDLLTQEDDDAEESEDQDSGSGDESQSEPESDELEGEEETEPDSDELEEAEEGQKPHNYQFANSTYSFEGINDQLHQEYPNGVNFDAGGYPDFSPYATEIVQIDMKGNYTTDYQDANQAAGFERTPEGYTWHHHQDGKTMLLVPTDLHAAVGHTGGVSNIKHGRS